jgi:hypothetical protein
MENELETLVSDIYDVCEQHTAADVGLRMQGGEPPDVPLFCKDWETCKAELVKLLQEWQAKHPPVSNVIPNSTLELGLPLVEF